MKLTRLELSGFKSFADTVGLTFEDGITAIVGPNGCGKSNISDAVRWVLGEQRARILRGTRMDDIIFQGTTKRKPVNVCEISLYFDNEDGSLPVSYREVVVSRRLSRSGQSDYFLNQQPVRLRDIQDLMRGTGLASEGGVVIEAQKIDRLLSDRPDERRTLFEEAAGIGLYRDRKTTTERRLEKTFDDLRRLDDLISEVHTQVRSLARQRGKADRYAKFTEERFGVVLTLARRSLEQFERGDEQLRGHADEIAVSLPEAKKVQSDLERERESRVQARATSLAQRTDAERRLGEQRLEVGRLEGELKLATERLQNAAERGQRDRDEVTRAQAIATQAEREKGVASEELKAAAKALESVQTELDLRSAGEQEARDRLLAQRGQVRDLESTLQRHAEKARSLAGEQDALERDIDDLRTQLKQAEQRLADIKRSHDEIDDRLDRATSLLERHGQEERDAVAEVDRARHEVAAAKEHEIAALLERRAAEESLARIGARREALETLERDRSGLAPAVRGLLEARQSFEDGTILGPLSDFLQPSAEGAALAERMLAEWLHAVLVKDLHAVEEIRDWHESNQPGPLLLLPLDPGPQSDTEGDPKHLDLVVTEPATRWTKALLGGNSAIDDEGHAVRLANGAVFLAGNEVSSGPLQRRAELGRLSDDFRQGELELLRLTAEADNAAETHAEADQLLDQVKKKAEAAEISLRESSGIHADCEREIQRTVHETTDADEARSRIQGRLEERVVRLDSVRVELKQVGDDRSDSERELERQRSLLGRLESEQEQAREHRVHWQVEEAQVTLREEAAREREERSDATWSTAHEEIESLTEELAGLDKLADEVAQQRSKWIDQLAERRAEVTELEKAALDAENNLRDADEATTNVEEQLEESRNVVQRYGDDLHRVELERTEISGAKRALVERVEVEWRRPLAELLEEAPEIDGDQETLRQRAEELSEQLQNLGPVNPLAADEHQEESKRLEFLQVQRDDLVDARTSLLEALKEIDDTARALFTEAFTAVRENFQQVFLTLFGSGECDVRLVDENDPLNSDIEIRAAPRGKRTQRIHLLSSGERALVAISLLFAIFLTKPSPFCLLDEVDAPLDDSNVQRFLRLLTEFKDDTQFIVITHNPRTMQTADNVYGVTMQEPGVSSIVGVRLGEHVTIA